jgi:methionyl-tRNA formyltransferase
MTPPLRVVFAGTPEFAASHLAALLKSDIEVVAVYTQPDRPSGRGKKLQPGPVKQLAQSVGLPVFQPASLKNLEEQQRLQALNADVMVVVAYGLILPQSILDIPRQGCLNVHASLLPRWRGAAPIQRAIEAGDLETGVTIMQMDSGLDTGDMLAVHSCPIESGTTSADLLQNLAALGAPQLLEVLNDLPAFQAKACKQDNSLATYAEKILKPEAQIDWNRSATLLERAVRAFNPFPVCYTTLGESRMKVWGATASPLGGQTAPVGTISRADRDGIRVQCSDGELCITHLQLPGGKALSVEQVLNAKHELFSPGTRLGVN